MKKFEYPDITTSDVAFRAYGKDLAELFANSGLALMEVTVNTKQIKPKVMKHIILQARDLKALMFDWLSELIFFIDSENLALVKFELKVDEKALKLEGTAWGETMDPDRHETRTHVKACTYHKMEIKKNKLWSAQVILDI
ncbi:MAG: archease [Candidatus Aenigmatarchaeota archaeon]